MKKLIVILTLCAATALVAAPKSQSLLAELWQDVSGVLMPTDGSPVAIYDNGGIGVGTFVEYWWGTPAAGEIITVQEGAGNMARVGALWFSNTTYENTFAGFVCQTGQAGTYYTDGMVESFTGISAGVPTVRLGGVTIQSGSAHPDTLVNVLPDGSMYLRAGVGMYIRESGVWVLK
jgi:hypothetical protein